MTEPPAALPTRLADAAWRFAYRVAYRLARAWWWLRRPRHEGVYAALWHGSRLLLVRNSYKPWVALPGGGRRPDESPQEAAARELEEELGISLAPEALRLACVVAHAVESRREELPFVEAAVESRPEVRIDRREIVWAGFVEAAEARAMADLYPPVLEYLEQRGQRGADHPPGASPRCRSSASTRASRPRKAR